MSPLETFSTTPSIFGTQHEDMPSGQKTAAFTSKNLGIPSRAYLLDKPLLHADMPDQAEQRDRQCVGSHVCSIAHTYV
jgi:hypothetical protein